MDTNTKLLVSKIETLYYNIKINKDIINTRLRQVYDHIKNTMSHLHSCYEKKIITKSVYSINIDDLESIFDMYKFIRNESSNIKLYNYILYLRPHTTVVIGPFIPSPAACPPHPKPSSSQASRQTMDND